MRQNNSALDITRTAVLEGCPDDLFKYHKIKILHNGGYEHFELVKQPSESTPESSITFRWIMRTKIAE